MGRGKRDKSLGGLADAFVKAGVADRRKAERARRERRREDAELGAEGVARREEQRRSEVVAAREAEAEAARRDEARRREGEEPERLRGLIRKGLQATGGPKRWFFVARDGRVPYLEINDGVGRLLADGEAGIVESLGATRDDHVVVLGTQVLHALRAHDESIVRFWNGPRR